MNQNQPLEKLWMGGSDDLVYRQVDDDEAAASKYDGKGFLVNIDSHDFFAGSTLLWLDSDGASAYNTAMRKALAVAANTITLSCDQFVTEDLQDTNYICPYVAFPYDWELHQFEAHLSSASATASENLTLSLDTYSAVTNSLISGTPGYWGTKLYSKDMNGVQDILWVPERPVHIAGFKQMGNVAYDSVLIVDWANASSVNWGVTITYRQLR